jgi:hypothetical protein
MDGLAVRLLRIAAVQHCPCARSDAGPTVNSAKKSRFPAVAYYLPMQCNIDSRGKAFRLAAGFVTATMGLGGLSGWFLTEGAPGWIVVVATGVILIGVFAIFEGWSGWCAVRAMGFRTRL